MKSEQTLPDLGVTMVRDNLAAIPHVDFPSGYAIRAYRPGDVAHWLHLHRIGDRFIDDAIFTEAYFAEQFGADQALLQSRMFYIESARGEVVGSISAWFTNEQPARGRIHWVIVHPDHRRRGLTKPMMSHAMQRLAQDHQSAMLDTSIARPWAIKVYLDFGFHPLPAELTTPEIFQGWVALQRMLNHPLLRTWLEHG